MDVSVDISDNHNQVEQTILKIENKILIIIFSTVICSRDAAISNTAPRIWQLQLNSQPQLTSVACVSSHIRQPPVTVVVKYGQTIAVGDRVCEDLHPHSRALTKSCTLFVFIYY